ncbi:flippase [Anaerostipes hadrus]|uniref:flippase n=1 Tax=Anaerostipes hadrus TaxID=649756 RepID=UPI00156D93F6|nr:flippase [Anaerostipes hadrus]MCB5441015.1 flippase [Anaerostipes hadrus]NSG55795.1 flippase [Anaerostipes hadrus]NSG70848.1 flippase [Anaerostipes hadrus]
MKSLAKNSFYNIIYQVLNLLFPLVTSVYVSRIIFEDGIGKVAYAQNITSYFVTLALLGFPAYGVREISKIRSDTNKKNTIFSELFFINFISTIILSIAYVLFIIINTNAHENFILYIFTGFVLFFNIFNIDWLYQGEEEYGYITLRSFIVKIICLILLLGGVKTKDDYILYALITSLGTVCNYVFNIIHSRKFVKFEFKNLNLKQHMRPLIVLTAAVFLGSIYNKIDITMLGMMSTDAVVGYYSNANKIIVMILTGCQAVSAAFMPRLSYLYTKDKKALEELIEFGCKILVFITIPATIGVYLLAPNATVVLYGESFAPAGITLQVFTPLIIIRTLGDLLCYQLLISIGQENKRLPAYVVAASANVILNYLLIPHWGQNGAAVASVISEFLVNGIQLLVTIKIINIHINPKYICSVLLSAGIMGGVIEIILKNVKGNILELILSVIVGSVTYILFSILFKNEMIIMIQEKIHNRVR